MKSTILSMACIAAITLTVGCQEQQDQSVVVKPLKKSSARRACGTTTYRFIYPDNGYGYNGNGCISYYVVGGQTRQFKVLLNNYAPYAETKQLRLRHPSNSNGFFQFSNITVTNGLVASVVSTDGSNTTDVYWTVLDMPAFTTYELTINVTVAVNASSGEGYVKLFLDAPCAPAPITDCDADENLHLVRTY